MKVSTALKLLCASFPLVFIQGEGECWDCEDAITCVKCTDYRQATDESGASFGLVTINVKDCKGGSISWACCIKSTGPNGYSACDVSSCSPGTQSSGGEPKCDDVSSVQFEVPLGTNSVTIQTHDGKTLGDEDQTMDPVCGGNNNAQKGCQTDWGHCTVEVLLSTCPDNSGGGGDCPTGDEEECEQSGTICQPKIYDTGNCQCMDAEPEPMTTECEAEVTSNCQAARLCDGEGSCQDPTVLEEGTPCGSADPAFPCDADDFCDGITFGCADLVAPATQECRSAVDSCDITETCDGFNKECPCDVTRNEGYTFKCATTQFLCGIKAEELTSGNGQSKYLGTCGIGTMKDYVILDYPACLEQPLEENCPPDNTGKVHGLSNYALGDCVEDGAVDTPAEWDCLFKTDVDSTTLLPYVPFPDFAPCGGGGGGGGTTDPTNANCQGACEAKCSAQGAWILDCGTRRGLGYSFHA